MCILCVSHLILRSTAVIVRTVRAGFLSFPPRVRDSADAEFPLEADDRKLVIAIEHYVSCAIRIRMSRPRRAHLAGLNPHPPNESHLHHLHQSPH